jgi:hypothetical protein
LAARPHNRGRPVQELGERTWDAMPALDYALSRSDFDARADQTMTLFT